MNNATIIRLPINIDSEEGLLDVNGIVPEFWNGTDIEFQIGLFENGVPVDVSNISVLRVAVKSASPNTGYAFMDKSVGQLGLDNSLTLDTWNDGSKQHASIAFSAAETVLPLTSDSTQFWIVISAVMDGASYVSVSSLTRTGAVATATSAAHGLANGTFVQISGASPSAYNLFAQITVVDANTFTYVLGADPGVDATGTIRAYTTPNLVVLGAGNITATESGFASEVPVSVVQPTYLTAAQCDARYAVTVDLTSMMPKAGGTFTGPVTVQTGVSFTLGRDPVANLEAATKQYVLGVVAASATRYVPLAGGTMTGLLQWSTTTSPGLRLNVLTGGQVSSLVGVPQGSMVFNSTIGGPQFYDGANWRTVLFT